MLVWSILHIHYWLFVAATLTPFLNAKKKQQKKKDKKCFFSLSGSHDSLTISRPFVFILCSHLPAFSSVYWRAMHAGKSWTPSLQAQADTLSDLFVSTRSTADSGSGRTPAERRRRRRNKTR